MIRTAIAATALIVAAASGLVLSGLSGPVESTPPPSAGAFYVRLALHIDGKLRGYHYWARNAGGWIAHAQASPGRRPASRELRDGKGAFILVNDMVRARSTFDGVERGLDPFGTPESGCTLTADGRAMSGRRVGETRIEGLRAIVFQKMNGTQERWTDWATPELGCVVLRSVTEYRSKPDEPWRVVSHQTAEGLEVGAHPAWIFTLTPDYREMSPKAVLIELLQDASGLRIDAVENSYQTNAARRRDPAYAGSTSPAPAATN
ncbi:MAG TPA: hypothetical protein VGK29_08710 [Paludibaculum sp.]|jgi:hypothetical protein